MTRVRTDNTDYPMSASTKPVILVFVGYYLPGFKAGGVISCVANIVNHLHEEFHFRIITRDRDIGEDRPYNGISPDVWQTMGHASVYYLPPGAESLRSLRRLVSETRHDLIYLNSFFESLCIKVLINRKLGRIDRSPIVLTPHGEFALPSLGQKHRKKSLYIRLVRSVGLYSHVIWHAASTVEAQDIVNVMNVGPQRIKTALQLPPILDDTPGDSESLAVERRSEELRVVFLSRISPEKNLDFALRVLSKVRTKVAFDMIGPIEKIDYWETCKVLLRELPSHVTARSLGPIVPSHLMKALSQYDLLFFPSRGEAYGQVIAESLMSGTQVLISTKTPWRDLESKGLGWDLPLEDINSFVNVVDGLGSTTPQARFERRKMIKANMNKHLLDTNAVADIQRLFTEVMSRREDKRVD